MFKKKHYTPGLLIDISGIDGAGKTSIIDRLNNYLSGLGYEVLLIKSPSDFYRNNEYVTSYHEEGKENIRIEALALLSAYDKLVQIEKIILPHLISGGIVITDKFLLGTYVDFSFRGVDIEWLTTVNKFCLDTDITVVLDCCSMIAQKRIQDRGKPLQYEESHLDILERKRQKYLELCDESIFIIDAKQSLEDVFKEVKDIVDNKIVN